MRLNTDQEIRLVVDRYAPMVYRLAYARTHSHTDAEDISQEVFLSLIRSNPDFEAEENRKAWLLRVTVNKANSLWRSSWRRRVQLSDAPLGEQAEPTADEALQNALDALLPQERTLIHLFYYEGYPSEEIAHMLGWKHATVRTRLFRARKRLKAQMQQEM
ncbi:MAG: RNA polymerase sigma factor [Clostridia bacterium]|nr:RNA polymerase sigma factor [Clostridia bacterium]